MVVSPFQCRDLTGLAALENSVESTLILDLIGDYAAGEWEAQKPEYRE